MWVFVGGPKWAEPGLRTGVVQPQHEDCGRYCLVRVLPIRLQRDYDRAQQMRFGVASWCVALVVEAGGPASASLMRTADPGR